MKKFELFIGKIAGEPRLLRLLLEVPAVSRPRHLRHNGRFKLALLHQLPVHTSKELSEKLMNIYDGSSEGIDVLEVLFKK